MEILICDQNLQDAGQIGNMISSVAKRDKQSVMVKYFEDGKSLLDYMKRKQANAVILETELPDQSGSQIAQTLRKSGYGGEILFLTHSKEHYDSAFDVRAFHYLLKEKSTGKQAQGVIRRLISQMSGTGDGVLFSNKGVYRQIKVSDIYYFEIYKRTVTVHYKENEFKFLSTIEKLQKQMSGYNFIRVHRSFLISFAAIEQVQNKMIKMKNGDLVPIGRTYQKEIQEILLGNRLKNDTKNLK